MPCLLSDFKEGEGTKLRAKEYGLNELNGFWKDLQIGNGIWMMWIYVVMEHGLNGLNGLDGFWIDCLRMLRKDLLDGMEHGLNGLNRLNGLDGFWIDCLRMLRKDLLDGIEHGLNRLNGF
jgi:hypothetical protein